MMVTYSTQKYTQRKRDILSQITSAPIHNTIAAATLHSTNTFYVKFIIHSYVGKFITYTKNCQVSMSGIMFNVGTHQVRTGHMVNSGEERWTFSIFCMETFDLWAFCNIELHGNWMPPDGPFRASAVLVTYLILYTYKHHMYATHFIFCKCFNALTFSVFFLQFT